MAEQKNNGNTKTVRTETPGELHTKAYEDHVKKAIDEYIKTKADEDHVKKAIDENIKTHGGSLGQNKKITLDLPLKDYDGSTCKVGVYDHATATTEDATGNETVFDPQGATGSSNYHETDN